jgi:RES domain-containing protein
MRVWRLCRSDRATTALSGEGARRLGGRWNEKGTRVVYCGGSLSLAILELLVHLEAADLPTGFVAVPVELPDDLSVEEVDAALLAADWRAYPAPSALPAFGSQWARERRTCALRVPSVVVPEEHNYVLNPSHPDFARVVAGAPASVDLDPRLLPT